MKLPISVTISCLFIILTFTITSCQLLERHYKSWEDILANQIESLPDIKIADSVTPTTLIVKSSVDGKKVVISHIKNYLSTNYSPILMSLYLSSSLTSAVDDSSILDDLLKYYKIAGNSTSCYYLSYYYLIHDNYKKSLNYLHKGNQKPFITDNEVIKKIIYHYLVNTTKNEIIALVKSITYMDYDQESIFRELSKTIIKSKFKNDFSKDVIALGRKIEKNSLTVSGKLTGIAIQLENIQYKKESIEIIKLKNKLKYVLMLPNKLENKSNKKKLLNYLNEAYDKGEYYALKKLAE